jgi:hypothetical protein
LSLREILTLGGGLAGVAAFIKYVIDLFVNRRQRSAAVGITELDADGRRIQMADSIITRLQTQLDGQQHQLEIMQTRLDNRLRIEASLRRRIVRLERIILLNGLSLPPEESEYHVEGT